MLRNRWKDEHVWREQEVSVDIEAMKEFSRNSGSENYKLGEINNRLNST
jgi:hypothetical protein